MNIQEKTLLHIALIQGIGPSCVASLIAYVGIDRLADIYKLTVSELVYDCGLTPKQAQLLERGLQDLKMLEQECALLEKYSLQWMSYLNQNYPPLLREIHAPPVGIFVQGQLPDHTTNSLAVVGARKANNYAQRVINYCIPDLVLHGWAIISGGALGADTMAHEKTLQAKGQTVAILGSGLLKPYPSSNKNLFSRIVQAGGAIVSPFPLTMEALPGNFPARNRLIAGMSRGCLVVQAGQKSGALITAYCALEQGREVFAVPGPIDDSLSDGCLSLLQQGAVMTRSAQDILAEFGYVYAARYIKEDKEEKLMQVQKNEPAAINEPEDIILVHCNQPASVDELFEKTGLPLPEIYVRLSSLQLEGKIEQNFTGLWQKL